MSRPDIDTYLIDIARVVATRATCLRRSVGCVLADARGHVLATGYNGRHAGAPHCNEEQRFGRGSGAQLTVIHPHACLGALARSGADLDMCEAIHAEQNALLQCRDVGEIATAYVTTFPCLTCVKLLLNTACRRIVYADAYGAHGAAALELWERAGRSAIANAGSA